MSKYKIGWYADDLEELEATHDSIGEMDSDEIEEFMQDVAREYAEKNHQIDEDSDLEFSVFVEFKGELKEVKFKTEFDPVYSVDSIV